ncbi:MAG: phage portal protein [Planctomyces sp.]|nr:phage portal protein [Planctomyces sp.]
MSQSVIRDLVRRSRHKASRDDYATAKNGLDSVRAAFYGTTGRLPNTRADQTRRTRSITGGPGDRHMSQLDLWTEREISRYLRDESTVFDGMIQTWAAEVIQCGFRLKPDTGEEKLNAEVQEALFGWDGDEGWASECDARGMMHFWDLVTLGEETELTDGDVAYYLDPEGNNGRGTISIIEGDRILTPAYGHEERPGHILINGVEMDMAGRPTRFWIADEAPQYCHASSESGRFYPAFDPKRPELGGVLFSVELRRYSATRRQPWLSSAVRAHDEIDDVFVAVRIALRNIACRSTYTKIQNFEQYLQWLQSVDPNLEGVAPEVTLEHTPNPGDHNYLNPGEELGVVETNAPGDNFDPFMQLQLNMLGLGIGMCLEESTRIFQKSFSSSRMAVEGTRRRYERRQKRIKRCKVSPILKFGVARLQAVGDLRKSDRASRIRSGYPGYPYMEPQKDANASKILVETKLRSRRTCATEIGDDYDAELPLIQEEEKLFPAPAAPAANSPPADSQDEPPGDQEQ